MDSNYSGRDRVQILKASEVLEVSLVVLLAIGSQFERLAQEAVKENQSHIRYLAELLGAELDERERHTVERRIKEARFPRVKTLDDFDFVACPSIQAVRLRELSDVDHNNESTVRGMDASFSEREIMQSLA